MRKLLIMAMLLAGTAAMAQRDYYVASNGNDANNGTSPTTPWQSLAKVNGFSFTKGDRINFRCGDSWYGTLRIVRDSITVKSYGIGAQPILTGAVTISGWVSSGNGVWSVPITARRFSNMVTLNGVPQPLARTPNRDSANAGYRTFTKVVDTLAVGGFTGIPVGSELVLRMKEWRVFRAKVDSVKNDTCYYSRVYDLGNGIVQVKETPTAGYGYFWQNDSSFLDQLGEYHYDHTAGRLRMFFGAANPSSFTVRMAVVDTLLALANLSNLIIDGLQLEYGNMYGLWGSFSSTRSGLTIRNCTIQYIGGEGMGFFRPGNVTIEDNTIRQVQSCGIFIRSNVRDNIAIRRNVIDSIGLLPGMGSVNKTSEYTGLYVDAQNNLTISENRLSNIGSNGIRWQGSNVVIDRNLVDSFCKRVTQDFGGIYTYNTTKGQFTNRVIRRNVVRNGIGAREGTTNSRYDANGIYTDGNSDAIRIDSNVITGVPMNSIQMNSPSDVSIRGNKFYLNNEPSCSTARAISWSKASADTVFNLDIKANIFMLSRTTQRSLYYINANLKGQTPLAAVATSGTIDSNYYNRGISTIFNLETYAPAYALRQLTLQQWKDSSGYDAAAVTIPTVAADSIVYAVNAKSTDTAINYNRRVAVPGSGELQGWISIPAWDALLGTEAGPLIVDPGKRILLRRRLALSKL